jgi:hypothetical protein
MLNRIALTILASIVLVVILTAIMSFAGAPQEEYMPYIYFVIALVVLSAILPAQPLSMIV